MWKTDRDPVKIAADRLTAEKVADRAALDQMRAEVEAEVQKAVAFAIDAPYPTPDKVDQDIYA